MKNITIYLDMDGVLCNFEKAYRAMWDEFVYDRERFKEAVLVRKIFSTLEWMPNAQKFIDGVRDIEKQYGVTIEMLTSTGTSRSAGKHAAIEQKTQWLKDHGIYWQPNFVCSKPEKAKYASDRAILVDDMEGCTVPFVEKGGVAFLHKDSDYSVTLSKIINVIPLL